MKRSLIKLLFVMTAIVAPMLAKADLIFYDGFNYPNGFVQYVSTNLWITNSFGGAGSANDMYVTGGRLEVSATGGIVSRANDCHRFLSVTNDSIYTNQAQVLYASYTIICTNLPNGAGTYFASFYASPNTGGGYYGRMFAATNGTVLPHTWRLGVSATISSYNHQYPVDLATNVPYQVVAQLDPVNLEAITIWVNPIDSSDPSQTSSDVPSGVTAPIDAISFRQASSFGNAFFQITNLALATTFDEAATNIWPTNATAPVIVYQPVGVTNFSGATITLSGLANGQGLGSMTYRWQQDGQDYTGGSGSDSDVLTIYGAQTTDSGNFTLIATTPYGLSVTSSVAKVSISDQPLPPTFTAEPSSQSAYTGQTVTFSTTVQTPGYPTFTWYSNDVVVTAGQVDSGNTSTLELDNVQPSFAAAYHVAVTNSVYPTGIVSTNAQLVVKVPDTVSIAYLRTLVDPTTYKPTNVPPTIAYQVTGTVTTYTNLTTGDTSSYYLQDATDGINIFVTGGSTFRPAQGDVVTFVGVLSTYTSGLELYADASANSSYPFTSFTVLSNNIAGLPTPISLSYDFMNNVPYANYTLGGSLVQISDVHFGANAGNTISTTANTTITVTNSAGQQFSLFFPYLDQDVAGQTIPTYASTVSGILYSANYAVTNTIIVTRFSDINTNVAVTPIPLAVGYTSGTLTFNWSDPSFSLQYATNVAGPYTTIPGAASGFTTNTTDLPMLFFRLTHQ